MANPESRNITQTSFEWRVVGLESGWTSTKYEKMTIGTVPVVWGQTTEPVSIGSMTPSSSPNTGTQTDWGHVYGRTPGQTYILYASALTATDHKWYPAGSMTVTMQSSPKVRPDEFEWSHTKASDQPFKVSAEEWDRLQKNINLVRNHVGGLGQYTFISPGPGDPFSAGHYNHIISAISPIPGRGPLPPQRNSDDRIYASDINQLRTAINAVP